MRLLLALIIFFWSKACFSQIGYINQISDSTGIGLFGSIGFLDHDNNYLYVGINTNYDEGGYCNGSNGQSFILKLDKTNGAILNSFNFNFDTLVSEINTGFYYNNSIYFGGKTSHTPWSHSGSYISKYNFLTQQLEWTKGIVNTSHYKHGIQSLKLNPYNKTIYFSGNDLLTNPNSFGMTIGGYIGIIDTLGNNFYNSTCAIGSIQKNNVYLSNLPVCSDYKIESIDANGYYLVSSTDISSRHHALSVAILAASPLSGMQTLFGGAYGSSYSPDSIFSRVQYANPIYGNKIIRVVGEKNKIHADISSNYTYNNCNHKTLDNLNLKHAYSSSNRFFITATDSSSDENISKNIITIELDTALNILNSIKLQIDSVWSNSSHATILDSANNFLYNVFLRKGFSDRYLYVQKMNLNNTNCHESPTFVSSLTNTLSAYTYTITSTDSLPKITYNPIIYPKGFKSEDACPFLNQMNQTGINNNDLFSEYKILTLPNNEFIIEGNSTIKEVNVINNIGQQIISKKSNDSKCNVTLHSHNNGIYFITITTINNYRKTFKVVKME